jgi:hypothetical protein
MTRRVVLRSAALAVAAVAVVAGLTVYFSTQSTPPCSLSGIPTWRPPKTGEPHRFAVVFPDEAACFFTIGDDPRLVAQLRLPDARGITAAVPNGSSIAVRTQSGPYTLDLRTGRFAQGGLAPFDHGVVTLRDDGQHALYVTKPGLFGLRVIDVRTGAIRQLVHFKGFSWNPRFGPNPPDHGLVLMPDRPELWVLDAPNNVLHVFDVSEVPAHAPRRITDVRLDRTMSASGSLARTADGRFLYVGDAGDVVDAQKREVIAQLDALAEARAVLEVRWSPGGPVFPGFPR